jgi:cytochrome c551/c552
MHSWRQFKLSRWCGGRISGAWIAAFAVGFVLVTSLSLLLRSGTAAASGNALSDAQIAHMSSGALTKYVFENQGCGSCHTVSADGKLGFTDRGKERAKGFEGCTALLTAMNVIAQVPQASRTRDEKATAARFQEFGCASCHQIVPGTMGLTKYAPKLKSLHVLCTEIQCTSCEGEKK